MNNTADIKRIALIVLDSVGIGYAEDAASYGDLGANTLGHIAYATDLNIPNLQKAGIGNIAPLRNIPPADAPLASYGLMKEASKGKDTTTGHWELAGSIIDNPFPTYPHGFPQEIITAFEHATGHGVIGNKVASGTEIIEQLGDLHLSSGKLIVYTSADSVFQIAAHEDIIPLSELYRCCEIARGMINVGRVIARPFIGSTGNFMRTSNRKDYALKPPYNVLNKLCDHGLQVTAIGKISDIFAGEGITSSVYTKNNEAGIDATIAALEQQGNEGLIFTNLVDFDMVFGHRRDVIGYQKALEYFDIRLPDIISSLRDGDLLMITADHGNDPIFKGTDHTRENVPILLFGKHVNGRDIGIRSSFSDVAATISELLLKEYSSNSFAAKV